MPSAAEQPETGGGVVLASLATASPACGPLDTAEELLQWQPGDQDQLRAAVPLPPSPNLLHEGPRLLACHDLAGGYHEDRWAQGCQLDAMAAAAAAPPAYFLRRWHYLDAFVYFSHRLVTIPPVGWVNAAHMHAVPVLGTLITEWDAGAAACRQLFGSAVAAEAAAAQLVAIAAYYGFDGWLINIENAVERAHIPHLVHFLRVLTEQMREAAPVCRHRVIWYDAVTIEGKLQWQNTLSDLNRPFFDACDAIWVNYTWRRSTPAAVRNQAGPRAADVYMGVDCFGRGTYGGGGFRCDTALRACLAEGLSAALFATAWPFEVDGGPPAAACWTERDAFFWSRIEQAWEGARSSQNSSADGGSGCSLCSSQQLPLYSNFSVGAGRAFHQRGRPVGGPWYNLSLQACQPLLRVQSTGHAEVNNSSGLGGGSGSSGSKDVGAPASSGPSGASGTSWLTLLRGLHRRLLRALYDWLWREPPCPVQAAVVDTVAFNGGSAVSISGSVPPDQKAVVQLFPAAVPLPAADTCVRLVARSSGGADFRLALCLAAAGPTAAPEAAAAGQASSPCCGTLELVPALSLPATAQEAEAAAASLQRWSSGTAAIATADRRSIAAWHTALAVAQRPGSSGDGISFASSAGQAAADQPAEWCIWEYRLPRTTLLAALSQGGNSSSTVEAERAAATVLLKGVDLLLCSSPERGQGGQSFQLYLGELCIEPAASDGWPAGPAGVQQLRCMSLQLADAPADAPAGSGTFEPAGQRLLSAQLAWQPPAGTSPRCSHVWCSFFGANNSGSSADPLLTPRWVGATCASSFRVASLPVPAGATAVQFAVQPEACNGQAQNLAEAAHVLAMLQQHSG